MAVITDKQSGASVRVSDQNIVISRPSTVTLSLEPDDILSMRRSSDDLILQLDDGRTLTLRNFYTGEDGERSELLLQDSAGDVWAGQYTDNLADFQFTEAGAVDQLAGAAAAGAGGTSALGLALPLAMAIGGIAVAGGLGGGSGDGGGNDGGTSPGGTPGDGGTLGDGGNPGGGAGPGDGGGDPDPNPGGDPVPGPGPNPDPDGDTTAPGTPFVALGNGDGLIGSNEIVNGRVTVTVGLAGTGAAAGDTLTINGTDRQLTQADIDAGQVVDTVAAPSNGQPLSVTTTLTDPSGNSSTPQTISALVDTAAPGSPVVTLGNGDPLIGSGEIVNGLVTVTVSLAATGAVVGDRLSINGAVRTLTQADIDAGQVIDSVAAPGNGQPLTVTTFLADAAGNASPPQTTTAVVDTFAPGAPSVLIGDGDGLISTTEIDNGMVTCTVSLDGTRAAVGYRLVIHGTVRVLDQSHIDAGEVVTEVAAPGNGQWLTVSATIIDPAGNASPPDIAAAVVAISGPGTPTVFLGNGDALIGSSEIVNGLVTVTVSLAGTGAAAGDLLSINGSTRTLSQSDINTGQVIETVTAPANGQTLTVTAAVTDSNGNTSLTQTVSAVVDTAAPGAPVAALGNGDAFIGTSEIVNGLVTLTVNLAGTGAAAGDRLSINGNTRTLTQADITAGQVIETVPAPANGQPLSVTTSLTDAAGNSSVPQTVNATVDTATPGAPVVALGNGDNLIGTSEIVNGLVTVTINLAGTGAAAGDRLSINGSTRTLTQSDITGGQVIETVAAPANGQQLSVTTSLTDPAGNASVPQTTTAIVNTSGPGAPSVTLGNGDNLIGTSEIVNGLVTVTVNLAGTGAVAGDRLSINGALRTLTQADITAGQVVETVTAPANGQQLSVTTTLADSAGNTSAPQTVSATVDTSAPGAPGVTLGNGDALIGSGEIVNGLVTVTVNLASTGAAAGDRLSINGSMRTLTQADITAGQVVETVAAPADGQPLTVSATITDAAGNTSLPQTASATVDISALGAPGVTLGNGDALIGSGEIVNGLVTFTVSLTGTGAAAGDRLSINGVARTLTQSDITAGQIVDTIAAPANGQPLAVTATLIDPAGNVSTPQTASAIVDIAGPGAPVATLGNGDALIGSSEIVNGLVTVTVSLAGTGAAAGDRLSINGSTRTLSQTDITAGQVVETIAAPGNGQTLSVTTTLTDPAGNASSPQTVTATVDTTAPGAPVATLGNGDALIGTGEIINGLVTVTVNLAGTGAVAGDQLSINGTTRTLTQADITAGRITDTVAAPANGQPLSVTTSLIDATGNASAPQTVTATVDTTAPGAPSTTIGNGDGIIGAGEIANGLVSVTVSLAGTNAVAGDRLTINGSTRTLSQADITAGQVVETVAAPANGQTLSVTTSLIDPAGNASAPQTVTATVDTAAPGAPVATLGNGDALIGVSEIVNGLVNVTVSLAGTGAVAGNELSINGIVRTLSQADITAGQVTATVTAPADGQQLSVTTALTDAAGNTSAPQTVTATVDTTPPGAPSTTIGNGDGIVGSGEIVNGLVSVNVSLAGTGAVAGDRLTINGSTRTLSQADITAGQVVETVTAPANGQTLSVVATLTDPAGNISLPSTTTAVVSTSGPGTPSVALGNGDALIGTSEIVNGLVTVTVSLAGTGAVAGDSLSINGVARTLTQADITAGQVIDTVSAPANGQLLTVTATVVDTNGNTSLSETVSATVDTAAPGTPGVTLGNGDGLIGAGEIVNGLVTVTVSLAGTGAAAGDRLSINGSFHTLSQADITAGQVVETITAPANGQSLTVNATLTDTAGNTSAPQTVTAVVDTAAPGTPVATLGNGDALIGTSEIVNGLVTVTVSLAGTGAVAGDSLSINGVARTLSQADIAAGQVTDTIPAPANGQALSVTTSLSDPAGNTSVPQTVTATVDTGAPGTPGITIGNGDGLIGTSEIVNGLVTVTVSLAGTGAAAGDRLSINGSFHTLSQADITAGRVTETVAAPPNGQQLTVSATLTDTAGNASAPQTASAIVDTAAPGTPIATLGNGDGLIGNGEIINGLVTVTVSLAGTGAVAGDSLSINGVARTLTQADITAGQVIDTIPAPASGQTLSVTTSLSDTAGNTTVPQTITATVDTSGPTAPGITIGNGDGLIGSGEIVNGLVTVTVNLAGAGAAAGDRLSINGSTRTLTQADITAGQVVETVAAPANGQPLSVTSTLTDPAGNASTPATANAIVDITAPGTPGVTIGNGDGLIGSGEIVNGLVSITVSLAGTGAAVGDRLSINGALRTLTQAEINAGQVVETLAAPANGQTLAVTALLTDAAGNGSTTATASAIVDISAPGAPVATLGNGDGLIGSGEIVNGLVSVNVSLAGTGAAVGDRLTINGSTRTLTQADITAGQVVETVAAPANGQPLTVTTSLTDPAGNSSAPQTVSAIVDLTAPGAPGVIIGNGDGLIGSGEIVNGLVTVRVSLAGTGAAAGDRLSINGSVRTLTQADITAGQVTDTVTAPANGQPLAVTATLIDPAGNSSLPGTASGIVDITAPGAPGVTIGNGDGLIGSGEIVNGLVSVAVSLAGTGAAAGDRLSINGNIRTLSQADIAAGQVVETITAPANGLPLAVTATLTDAAGNASLPGAASATVDTSGPGTPGVVIGNGDGLIGSGEIANGLVTVTVNLAGTGAVAGDRLTINGATQTLTQADITAGQVINTVAAPANGLPLNVTATLSDPAGNTSLPATANALVDTSGPAAPAVTIGNGDGLIGSGEIVNGRVAVTVSLAGSGATAGDRLSINGNVQTLSQADITAGQVISTVAAPANGLPLVVTATLTDPAGNISAPGVANATVDTAAPLAPTAQLAADSNIVGDGVTNQGTILVGALETGATFEYSTNGGTTWLPGTGTSFVLPAGTYAAGAVQVRQTDLAGNTGAPASLGATVVDTTAPSPTLALEANTGNPADNLTTDGTVLVSNIEPGQSWQYSINNGATWITGTGNSFELPPGIYASGAVQVRQADLAGNLGTAALGPVEVFQLDAVGDPTTVALTVTPTTSNVPPATGAVGGLLNLGLLGSAVDVGLISNNSAFTFAIPDNTIRQVTIDGTGTALLNLSLLGDVSFDLQVYRAEPGSTTATLVFERENWLQPGSLINPTWNADPLVLPQFEGGGTYYVVVANDGGLLNLSLLQSLTLNTVSDVITDYRNGSGGTSGNVLANDTVPTGTTVSSINGTTVAAGTQIDGLYGSLAINPDGTYTYTAFSPFTGTDGAQDVFTYTIRSPDGSTNTSALTVTLDFPAIAPELRIAADSGVVGDGITNNGTILVGGLEAGAGFEYSLDRGVTWTAGTGASFALAQGTYADGAVQVRQVDTDGTRGAAGSLGQLTVDTTPPPAPVIGLASDTGAIGDGFTSNGTVAVSGIQGTTWEYTVNGGTTWSLGTGNSFVLPVNTYAAGAVQVRQTDVAGNPAATALGPLTVFNLDAVNNTNTVGLSVTPTSSSPALQTGRVGGLLNLALVGSAIDVGVLSNNSALTFAVQENTTRQISLDGSGFGLLNLGLFSDVNFDLQVYRAEAGATTATRVYGLDNWLVGSGGILGANWDANVVTLPRFEGGGTYYVVLGNNGGLLNLSLLGGLSVSTTSDVINNYRNVNGTVGGNVLTDDISPVGTVVSAVNGQAVGAGSQVNGLYGTLTINPNGTYSYAANSPFTGSDGAQDVFNYRITTADGSTDTGTLTLTLDHPGVPPVATVTASLFLSDAIALDMSGDDASAALSADDSHDTLAMHARTFSLDAVGDGGDGSTADGTGADGFGADVVVADGTSTDGSGVEALTFDLSGSDSMEIDLSGLDSLDNHGEAPAETPELASADVPTVQPTELPDPAPIDPFQPLHHQDDQNHLPVV
ncbi:BapA prefix-like domain-containing protein [Rhizobium sp. 0TCS1.26]|uniref:BapA/Bap/LapF family prefix-like domain-containing protein n=1 Tax=Rhizobium sp. 0TCS1.26 TaxID=3142623 RepID=UPI003D27ACF3